MAEKVVAEKVVAAPVNLEVTLPGVPVLDALSAIQAPFRLMREAVARVVPTALASASSCPEEERDYHLCRSAVPHDRHRRHLLHDHVHHLWDHYVRVAFHQALHQEKHRLNLLHR